MATETHAHRVLAVVRAMISSAKAAITRTRTRYSTPLRVVDRSQTRRSAGFGTRTEGVALLTASAPTLGGCGRPSVTELTQAGLEEGLQPGAVLALERPQLVDLLLQRGPLRLDLPDDLELRTFER